MRAKFSGNISSAQKFLVAHAQTLQYSIHMHEV